MKNKTFNHTHLTLSELTPDTPIRETDLLRWRLRVIFCMNGIRTLRQLSGCPKSHFEGSFLCNEKAMSDMTLFLNCVHLDWNS